MEDSKVYLQARTEKGEPMDYLTLFAVFALGVIVGAAAMTFVTERLIKKLRRSGAGAGQTARLAPGGKKF
jgi:hypothetical protein